MSGNNNRFTFYCDGLSGDQGKQLLEIVNRIAKDQLDPRAVMKALDEIKALAAKGGTSPETIAKGLQLYASGQNVSPRALAETIYQRLSGFLDVQQGTGQMKRDVQESIREKAILRDYRSKIAPEMVLFLNELRARQIPVEDLLGASQNINSVVDIRRLAAGFKKLADDPRAQIESQVLEAMTRRYAELLDDSALADKEAVNSYHSIHTRTVTAALEQLGSQKIPVGALMELSKSISSTEDIRRLADGFKKLADSLPAR